MVLYVYNNAAYLVVTKASSQVECYYHLLDHPNITQQSKLNGSILAERKTLRHLVSSVAEVEMVGIFYNTTTAVPIHHILQALQYPQPPTPLTIIT